MTADTTGNTNTDAANTNNAAANKTTDTTANKYSKDNHLDKTTLVLTASFLAIYFVVYAVSGLFYDESDPSHASAKATMVDVVVLILIVFAGWVYYASLPPQKQDT
jgi:preprotein translocase subunit SecG